MGQEVRTSAKEVSGEQNGVTEANNLQVFISTIYKSLDLGSLIYMVLPTSRKLPGTQYMLSKYFQASMCVFISIECVWLMIKPGQLADSSLLAVQEAPTLLICVGSAMGHEIASVSMQTSVHIFCKHFTICRYGTKDENFEAAAGSISGN